MRRTLASTVVALVLVGCATQPTLPYLEGGEPELGTGSIVFTGADGNLYVAASGEPELVRITDEGAREGLRYSAYAWAVDRIVYTAQELAADGTISSSLFVAQPAGKTRRLFSEAGLAPFFLYPTADGTRVGFLGSRTGTAGYAMGSIELDGSARIDHGSGQPYFAAWAPDATALVTHIGTPGPRGGSRLGLQELAPDEREARRLAARAGVFQSPDYSPDGSRIAVVLANGRSLGIHLLDADGEDLGRLVDLEGRAASLAWSPAGRRLAYLDGLFTPFGALVGRLYVAGGASVTPRLVSEAAIAHFWSPDGSRLLFFEPYAEGGAISYRVGLYAVSDGTVSRIARMRPAPSFTSQIIPFVDQYERGYTIWSPDSRLVALNTLGARGQEFVHVLDTDRDAGRDALRVSFSLTQQVPRELLGIEPAPGYRSRAIAAGSVPFYSRR